MEAKTVFQERVSEIDIFFNTLKQSELDDDKNEELFKISKASAVLLLYNVVEGSLTLAIQELFDSFSDDRLAYGTARYYYQQIWLDYQYRLFDKSGIKPLEKVMIIENLGNEVIKLTYKQFKEKTRHNFLSGNVDSKKIIELCKNFEIPFPLPKSSSLLNIKNKRNDLAHGALPFSEIGGSISVSELNDYFQEVKYFIGSVLDEFENHIRTKGWRR